MWWVGECFPASPLGEGRKVCKEAVQDQASSQHLRSTYHEPGALLSALGVRFHLTLRHSLLGWCCEEPHVLDEDTEVRQLNNVLVSTQPAHVDPGFKSKQFHLQSLALVVSAEKSMHVWARAELFRTQGGRNVSLLFLSILLSSFPLSHLKQLRASPLDKWLTSSYSRNIVLKMCHAVIFHLTLESLRSGPLVSLEGREVSFMKVILYLCHRLIQ